MSGSNGDDLFKSLNSAQSRAVSSRASTVAILAGPGSGKTHTLTSRVVWLIDHVGIRPCDVIVATFTVKASNEMKLRIGQALGDGREKKIILGTFHSIARKYLAIYGKRIGLDPKFGIADDSDSRAVIKRICKRLDSPIEPAVARSWISKRKAKGTSDEQNIKAKNGKSIESKSLEQCFEEYQAYLERSNLLDYDDLLIRCVELLRQWPDCVKNIQTVLIDEYQDTNGVQYDLMKLFAQKNRQITIVGDPDQSIYGWRSAEIRNLHRLLRDFPGTDEISLEENYRSSSSILDVSLQVIQQDQERYKKILLPVHAKGTRPVLRMLKNSMTEADWIVSEIKRIKMMAGDMIKSDDIAILLRSASLSRHIESALGREGIAYRMVGGFKFYERVEIKTILDYLRVIHQPDNNDALARIMNVPKRGIGDVTARSLLEEAERSSMSLWELLGKHCRGERKAKTTIRQPAEQKISGGLIKLITNLQNQLRPKEGTPVNLVDIINQLLKDLQFEKHLEETHGPEYELRWANVQEFVNLAAEFMDQDKPEEDMLPILEDTQQSIDDDVLARFLANVSLASDKQANDKDKEQKPQVTVSTIHAAKGLEWPVVFVPAVYKGSIPHIRSDDQNEERRLLYVAMTRAQALLYLSCPRYTISGSKEATQISPFVENLSSSTFLKKGPSLDRLVMSEIARILRRDLPAESVIYKNIPMMTAIEDNIFPIDPNQAQEITPLPVPTGNHGFNQRPGQHKRQKISHTEVADESVEGWVAPYATTMQKSDSFTVPQPPPQLGFTTAGAHFASVTAADAAKPTAKSAQGAATKKPPMSRAPSQRSLIGYGYGITNHDKSKQVDDIAPIASSKSNQIMNRAPRPYQVPRGHHKQQIGSQHFPPSIQGLSRAQQKPAIEPNLAAHKFGSAKFSSRPTTNQSTTAPAAAENPPSKPKQYACFSSSPTKPQPAEEQGNAEKENVVPEEEVTRPAKSFHATTVNRGPQTGWRGGGGIQRPTPLGRSGITPMDRLKKPFKLTVKRPP
ncbi:P-loop containing nucleoside triphosphate hydrolase protein [Hypoxylon trugodes]|uniref:P-loop containing nucleoside triphosphate hydrolase protein n=1 Tax=Hypoxylon trugodes TaxID=326681 RepID=UPI00219F007A|nr:P-loop containing nucleoside triphosphate hydrolase protein [Hypoxylon trugodes]KAI1388011.1 P-loop containing nucleoside triphosphate hydrolase protein [Hypoxylon trugodes]